MSFAIFTTGGKQYMVKEGDEIFVEKLEGDIGKEISFETVSFINDKTGAPFVKGAKVVATIQKQGKSPKLRIVHFRAKKHHYKRQGHRQPYTKLKISTISL